MGLDFPAFPVAAAVTAPAKGWHERGRFMAPLQGLTRSSLRSIKHNSSSIKAAIKMPIIEKLPSGHQAVMKMEDIKTVGVVS